MDSRRARRVAVSAGVAVALAGLGAEGAAAAQPDLVINRVAVSSAFATGDTALDNKVVGRGATLRIAERTANVGGGFARRSITSLLLSEAAAGYVIGSRPLEALEPGGSSADVQDVVVPNVPPGTYRLVACADSRRRVAERRERNNCRTAPGRIVVAANKRPSVFIGGGAATGAVTENIIGGVLHEGGTRVTDADDEDLTGATVRIIAGATGAGSLAFANDRLFFVEQLGITGTYNSGTGVLTLRGRAPVADYQTALRSVLYQYLGDDPPASRRLRIVVRDAKGVPSAPVTRTIAITPVNDAPQVFVSVEALPYKAGSGPKAIAPDLALFDPDSQIASAYVTTDAQTGGILNFTNQRGITGTYNSGTGVLTLTGTASVSNYQAALRSVSFSGSGGGKSTFELQVTDARGAQSNSVFVMMSYEDG